jgi:GTP cyclohydrolase I
MAVESRDKSPCESNVAETARLKASVDAELTGADSEASAGVNSTSESGSPLATRAQVLPGGKVDLERIARAVREILLAVGENPDRDGLRDTPMRVARMYAELFGGLYQDPRCHLDKYFVEKYDEIVLVKGISFESMCEHHLLPFHGQAHVAYIPNGKIVGLSKLARVLELLAHRPQVQERLTEQLADLLMQELEPKGVAVIMEATHTCMTIRGIRKPTSVCTTSAMRGVFKSNLSTRTELMSLIYGSK